MIISLGEVIDMVAMTLILGIIFQDSFRKFQRPHEFYGRSGFDWEGLKFAMIVTAPAIIFHEFGHKFVAMGLGAETVFHAAYGWLIFGVLLKLLNVGFIFFVPAYVSIEGALSNIGYSVVAFAGPAVNLILWLVAKYLFDHNKVQRKYLPLVYLTKQINMFLFVFNMLPIPGFDGFKVYEGLIRAVL